MPGMTCGETAAKTSSLSTNETQLVHSVSSLLPSHSVIPPRVPTLRREEATLLSQAEQAGHASANDTHTQPFRAEPPMGCGEDSSPCSGGRGSSVARFHDSRIKTRGCTAAFRALLRMAERMHPGQMNGQDDQQGSHPAVHLRSATIRRDCGNNAVIQRSPAVTFGGAPAASSEKSDFHGPEGRGNAGILFPLFPGTQENRRAETDSRSSPIQQINRGEAFSHANNQTSVSV